MNRLTASRAILVGGFLLWAIRQGARCDTNMTIRAVIIAPPPCVINSGSTLNVTFGNDLNTTRIDGVNYRRDVPYTLRCDSPLDSNAMTLELLGTGASFDSSALSTSKADLGVKLLANGAVWPLNSNVRFTYPNAPALEAVPVQRAGSTLTAGAFAASATLVVHYQ
ncbi:fimbrial protein [Pseudomonas marginalis]